MAWFGGLFLASMLFSMIVAMGFVPMSAELATFGLLLIAKFRMLKDSFRPGKMTPRLWLASAAIVIAFAVLPTPESSVVKYFKVPSGGMEPTLRRSQEGSVSDHIVVDRLTYRFRKPRRGEILVFATSSIERISAFENRAEEIYHIKRIVGLPGEVIEIRNGVVFADGEKLTEADGIPPIAYGARTGTVLDAATYAVGDHEYFALGDNTSNSWDSRHWGNVPESAVFGRVTKIFYPFSRIGIPSYDTGNHTP